MNSFSQKASENPVRILVVDDEPQIGECFKAILENASFTAEIAHSGDEALALFNERDFDLVLSDVVMPGMNGLVLAKKLKAMVDPEGFLPVVLVTAFADEKGKIDGLSHADAYLSKPVSHAELIAIVKSLLKIRILNLELARTKDHYKELLENFPHMYITITQGGSISLCNKLFRDTFQLSMDEVATADIFSLLKDEDRTMFRVFLESLGIEDFSQQQIFRFCLPAAGTILYLNVKAVITDKENSGRAIAIAMEDVTLKMSLEEDRKLARKQLYRSARLASVGTLASGVAHELNNPLTAIMGFSSALISRMNNKEEIDAGQLAMYLQIIHNETIRCRDIVENLHRFSREHADSAIGRVSIFECIVNALRLINSKAARKNITILNEIQVNMWVNSDVHRLEQVFLNLLTNCIDFCSGGSTVRIAGRIGSFSSKFISVIVSDNGPGMQPEVLAHAFDPFFTTKEVGKGIGMGLSICHTLMEELGGRIDIISDVGSGTTVTLEIPREQ